MLGKDEDDSDSLHLITEKDIANLTIAVIMPTLARSTFRDALQSVREQSVTPDEVLILSDERLSIKLKWNEKILLNSDGFLDKVRVGLNVTSCDLVTLVDDDASIGRHWLKNMRKWFEHDSTAFVCGSCLPLLDPYATVVSRAISLVEQSYFGSFLMSERYRVREQELNPDETRLSGMGMYRRDVLQRILTQEWEKIAPSAWENIILTWIAKAHYDLIYDPSASFFHRPRDNLTGFFRQIMKSGSGRAGYFRINKNEILRKWYMFVPSVFLLYLMTLPFLFFMSRILLSPLYAYVIALALATLAKMRTDSYRVVLLFPVIVFAQHLAYGIGFIRGMFTNPIRKWPS
jgi:cellulose synthase/poly-beta-1,6-N-acetylglucosamine synthase-like glycosyltransferase